MHIWLLTVNGNQVVKTARSAATVNKMCVVCVQRFYKSMDTTVYESI